MRKRQAREQRTLTVAARHAECGEPDAATAVVVERLIDAPHEALLELDKLGLLAGPKPGDDGKLPQERQHALGGRHARLLPWVSASRL